MMEVVLVVAILVIISAISIPVLVSMRSQSSVHAATDSVRTQLITARNRAMEERQPYRFAIKYDSGNFRIAPDTADYWGDGAPETSQVDNAERPPLEYEGVLPEDVIFPSPNGGSGAADWHTVAVFLADGTAQNDVEIGVGMRGTPPVIVRLQASTGAITTAAIPTNTNAH
jgi:Tfp pilus assembly protein FimT